MKKIVLAWMLCFCSTGMLSALSMGNDGEPYEALGKMWQRAYFEDADGAFDALFPGDPTKGLANGKCFIGSKDGEMVYEVNTSVNDRFNPPATLKEFVKLVKESYGKAEVSPVYVSQTAVKYAVEVRIYDKKHKKLEQMQRIYSTANRLYYAIVIGDDLSLAPYFFDHVQIKK